MGSTKYMTLSGLVVEAAEIFKPPEKMTVTEAAVKYRYLKDPPKYSGPYKADETPYMVEPQNQIMSRQHTALFFAGPSQSSKTESLILNTICYVVKCFPMDMLLFGASISSIRDFSHRRVDRMHKNSKEIGAELMPGKSNDNTHDKTYKSGISLSLLWPSPNEMSSKPAPLVMITEYDRMPEDIGGEGSGFILAQQRTTSYMNMGMTVVESSPAREITDLKWKPTGDHEAPPCTGVLGLYNQGTRKRWYWPCPHCGEFFEASFKDLVYSITAKDPKTGEKRALSYREIGDTVHLACKVNGCTIEPHHKYEMNLNGVWLAEGEKIRADGTRYGTPLESDSESYWLKGPAAAYSTWRGLVIKYLKAEKVFFDTGSQEDLKTTTNTDQGELYVPRGSEQQRLAEDIQAGAFHTTPKTVPADVRALFSCTDVQDSRYVNQVMGLRPGLVKGSYDIVVIDRFDTKKSKRLDEDGERYLVKPATYLEDWDLLEEEVMNKRYELADGSGTMGISMSVCDSGGKEGVTGKAYDFWRKMKTKGKGNRFLLVKGDPNPKAPRVHLVYPDSQRKDRFANARGEIPVLLLNSNVLKDMLDGMLNRTTSGGGKVDFPDWLDLAFFEELTVESRNFKGQWENPAKRRNESWDLLYYFIAICVYRGIDRIDWTKPPPWLQPWETNTNVEKTQAQKPAVDKEKKASQGFADLAADLA